MVRFQGHRAIIVRRWALGLLAGCLSQTVPAAEDIVLLQSLPLSGPASATGLRVFAGATAAVARENAAGGLQGRPIRLISVDDAGDPGRTAGALRGELGRQAVHAVINCVDDQACLAAARVAADKGVLLFGPLSGSSVLSVGTAPRWVMSLRAGYRREAEALASQLRAVAAERALVLNDGADGEERAALAAAALAAAGIKVNSWRLAPGVAGAAELTAAIATHQPQILVLAIGARAVETLATWPADQVRNLPPTLASFGAPGLTQLGRLFRQHALGFTSVVPNPESSQLAIAKELAADAERQGGPHALSFEGLEAYLNVRALVQLLRQRGRARLSAAAAAESVAAPGSLSVGGFRLEFGRGSRPASDWVDVGIRTRDGVLRQ